MSSSEVEFKISNIQMSKSSFELLSREPSGNYNTDVSVTSKISKSTNTVKVFIDIDVKSKSSAGADVYQMKTSFIGWFSFTGTHENPVVANFAKGNGPGIVYPFIRSAIANLSLAAGVPVITLPIINFLKFPVKVEVED